MPTVNGTRSLAAELELAGEQVRDGVLNRFTSTVLPVLTDAFVLSGQADLMVDPEADEMWHAKAVRTAQDLAHVTATLDALTDHLLRENYEVERIIAERHRTGPAGDEIAEMRGQVSRLLGIVEQLRGEQDGGAS